MVFIVPLINRNANINFEKFYDTATKDKVNGILHSIKENNIIGLIGNFDKSTVNIETRLVELDNYFLQNNLKDEKLVNCSFEIFNSITADESPSKITKFVYSVVLEEGYGILYIDIAETNGTMRIQTLRLSQLEKPMDEYNKFYGQQMNSTRIFLLITILAVIILVMYTEYDYYKLTPNRKVWIQLLLPVSAIAFSINWNLLTLDISVINVSITPVSLFSSGVMGEWKITFYVPVILILYWVILRKKQRNNSKSEYVA